MQVRRTLPQRGLPLVGAWCFLDEFGPQNVDMRVLPHPHTGLQTVTWPVAGEILHRDSVGSEVVVRPGQLNLMTAGRGVSHSEFSLGSAPLLHAAQLWVALPDGVAEGAAGFEQVSDLPVWSTTGDPRDGLRRVELDGHASPARVHTPLLGAEVTIDAGRLGRGAARARVRARGPRPGRRGRRRRHAARTERAALPRRRARRPCRCASREGARILLLGGAPFEHDLVMWWNFVGRDHADIAQARADWESPDRADRFGIVHGHGDQRIPAPELPNIRLQPRRRQPPKELRMTELPVRSRAGRGRAGRRRRRRGSCASCPTRPAPPPRPPRHSASRSARSPTA